MKTGWLYEIVINRECDKHDAKSIIEAIKEIRTTLEEKGCKFSITAVCVLGNLLEATEKQAQGRIP